MEKVKTMDDKYQDGSDHEVCEECGLCKTCDDCVCEVEVLRCNNCNREIGGAVVLMPTTEKIRRVQCTDCAKKMWTEFGDKMKRENLIINKNCVHCGKEVAIDPEGDLIHVEYDEKGVDPRMCEGKVGSKLASINRGMK